MIKNFTYEFTVTDAPVSFTVECEVPKNIKEAALDKNLNLEARVDPMNGAVQLGTLKDGELVLVNVKVTAEQEPVKEGDDLRREIQKMMFI